MLHTPIFLAMLAENRAASVIRVGVIARLHPEIIDALRSSAPLMFDHSYGPSPFAGRWPDVNIASYALVALHRLGVGHDETHFLSAHKQGCCHLCHVAYDEVLDAHPCPHWFVAPGFRGCFHPIFETFALKEVLYFLLLYMREATGSAQTKRQIVCSFNESSVGIRLRLGKRRWSFELPRDAGDGPTTVVIQSPGAVTRAPILNVTAGPLDVKALNILVRLAWRWSITSPRCRRDPDVFMAHTSHWYSCE